MPQKLSGKRGRSCGYWTVTGFVPDEVLYSDHHPKHNLGARD
jgi:hypothetical protein